MIFRVSGQKYARKSSEQGMAAHAPKADAAPARLRELDSGTDAASRDLIGAPMRRGWTLAIKAVFIGLGIASWDEPFASAFFFALAAGAVVV